MPDVTLIGYPFGSTGRAEHVRAVWRALTAARVPAKIYDISGYRSSDEGLEREFRPAVIEQLSAGLRIYSLNGDEIASALETMETRQSGIFRCGYNIVFPAWELPCYPQVWARELDRFGEVWTASAFADQSIRAAVKVPVFHLPNACEPHIEEILGKAYFGIPENHFAILCFFDLRSYTSRKNPWAAIDAFGRLTKARPSAPVRLVIKINNSSLDISVLERVRRDTADLGDRVTIIDATMKDNEVKNLIRCCDCLLSLHRSEGFGRGPAEAMFFGRPVVATGWSGNMEYMNADVSFPVGYRLIPVKEGEYPQGAGQVWAEPDIDAAAVTLARLVDDPAYARAVGERARIHMRKSFSDIVLGQRYRTRLEAITARAGSSEALLTRNAT
jgi:glycosyltransferase involved in cell wall biosynthesis